MTAPPLQGVLETAVYVDNLERSVSFYERVLGLEILGRNERMCSMSVSGRQVFLIFAKGKSVESVQTAGGLVPGHGADGHIHLAFAIEKRQTKVWRNWLQQNNIDIESTVRWEKGGESIYFRDPDQHILELVTPGTWAIY